MNARETNRPGGRNRQIRTESAAGDEQAGEGCTGCIYGCLSRIFGSCLLLILALAAVPALLGALDLMWG